MEVWQIVLYGTAALFAMKSLSSLMTVYRENLISEFEAEEEQRRQEEAQIQAEAAAAKKKKKTHRAGAA